MKRFTQDLHEYLRPFWKGNIVENETLMLLGESDRGVLLYEPKEVLSVRDYFLEQAFQNGADYRVEGRCLLRTGSRIPYWTEDEYYTDEFETIGIGANKEICERYGVQKYLKYGEGNLFTQRQLAVSYTHEGVWNGPVPQGKSAKFAHVLSKLKNGEACKLLFYGDSITTGCNASGTQQGGMTPPYMPSFPDLVCEYLREEFSVSVECVNTAVGGMGTRWGVENLEERVIAYAPDLVFLAFGMNDPGVSLEQYGEWVCEMIEKIRSALPQTEIVLVSSILPNPDANEGWVGNQSIFHRKLTEIERKYPFVGTANVTEMQEYMVNSGKHYRDMTANNINHPNDFGHRLYAQVILTTLLGSDFEG